MQSLAFSDFTAPALKQLVKQDAIIIVPLGATEQHGPHLPVMVDSRLVTEAAMRTAKKLDAKGITVLVTPTIWTGFSEHHMELGGRLLRECDGRQRAQSCRAQASQHRSCH